MIDTTLEAFKDILRAKLEEHPEYPDVRNSLGLVYAFQGSHQRAIPQFQEALRTNPKYTDGLLNLGFSLLETGKFGKAEQAFNKAASLSPEDARPVLGLALVRLRAGKGQQALDLLRSSASGKKHSLLLYRMTAYVLLWLDRIEEAVEELKACSTLAPYAKKHLNKSKVLRRRGEAQKEAIRAYFRDVEFNPNYGSLHQELAKILAHHRRFRTAQRELEKGLLADGSLTDYHNALGSIYYLRGSYKRAIASYRRATEIDPAYGKAHINLAFKYAEHGEVEEAVKELRVALRIHPDYADLHYNLGLWHLDAEQLAEAEKEFRTALRLNSNYLMARNSLAYALYKMGNYNEAIKQYKQVMDDGLMSADIYANVGAMHVSRGEYGEAKEALQNALDLDPDFVQLHYWLGKAYLGSGEVAQAAQQLRRFVAVAKDRELVAEAQTLLSKLSEG